MDATPRQSIFVAAAAAVCTVVVALLLSDLTAEPSFWLQIAPLSVYFLHVVGHRRLPERVDRTRNWIVLTGVVSLAALGTAVL